MPPCAEAAQRARALARLGLVVLAASCSRVPGWRGGADGEAPGAATAPSGARVPPASAVDAQDASIADAEIADAEDASPPPPDEHAYTDPDPRSGRSLGHTSVVFKLELANGKKAVFKPASRRGPKRYKGEIAAHRLGVALGLPNVPRAYFRTFDDRSLRSALAGPAAELYAREVLLEAARVKGAIIPWIDDLEFLDLEREPWWSRWRGWLRKGATIPDAERALAAEASTMVCFDWLTGNWDRWSGGNVGQARASPPAHGRLLFIDNDGAFFDAPPKDGLDKTVRLLDEIDRFSRSFVARVRALDDAALAAALGDESAGTPLLSPKALAGVAARRVDLLRRFDQKMAKLGEAEVLFFP